MRFDELRVHGDGEDELQLRFHPQLTMLAGLGADERVALADGIVGALAGGPDSTALRYLDAGGEPVVVLGRDGHISARRDDGTPVPEPVGSIAPSRQALRELIVIRPDDIGPAVNRSREDEPPELTEARDTLEELTAELEAARAELARVSALRSELHDLDENLRLAREGAARREYALVLAQLERVRAEASALDTDERGILADRKLLAIAADVRALGRRWLEAATRVAEIAAAVGDERPDPQERERLATIPSEPPEDLSALVKALADAARRRDHLDNRLQDLAVARLPAPSDPVVAELGLLDQRPLWQAAEELQAANESMRRVQLSLGGLELEDLGPPPSVIAEIEEAHAEVEEANQAAEQARVTGLAAGGVCLGVGVLGIALTPFILPVGLIGAVVAATTGFIRPQARVARANRAEQAALTRADATSYLGFHIRRVEASVDPHLREMVDATTLEHRRALAAWTELAGNADVDAAVALRPEVEAYHAALRDLGSTAEEMEHLRRELAEQAVPAWQAARAALAETCAPYLVDDAELDRARLPIIIEDRCRVGASARAQAELADAQQAEQQVAERLSAQLVDLGFDAGELEARVGALDWAIDRAEEREEARLRARPREEIEAELTTLGDAAARLRQPEWDTVTAAEADLPDIPHLEARREVVVAALGTAKPEVDVERLSDRHAAVERRVAALDARFGGATNGDPGYLADLQQHLLARLTAASTAAPGGDAVPVVLDEAFQRVPPDRSWDLLDLVLRLSERHQIVYLTGDAFVAAWARQRALDGSITLMEPAPESESETESETEPAQEPEHEHV